MVEYATMRRVWRIDGRRQKWGGICGAANYLGKLESKESDKIEPTSQPWGKRDSSLAGDTNNL